MINSDIYNISNPEKGNKKPLDKKLIINLKKKIYKTIKKFNAYLIHDCDVFKNFTGRDIDALYKEKNKFLKSRDDIILRDIHKGSLRIHINHPNNKNFLSLDIEETTTMPHNIEKVFKKNFNIKVYCDHTKVQHLDNKSLIFYKLVKYFYHGTIHSFSQLLDLKKRIKKLKKDELNLIIESVKEALANQKYIINNFIYWKFNKFYKNVNVKEFFFNLRYKRHKKRKVFSGKLNLKKVFFSKKFIYAFLLGSKAKWNRSHNTMPAITIVGNDGSGKTTLVNYIRANYSKMDPLIFDMKSSNPFFSINIIIRNALKKIKSSKIIKNIFFLNTSISFIGESLDLFDKFVKYKIGMAWADAGFGLTIFERYPTDRIRGEFPNKKNRFLPLEQFFPFPDGMIYLDILPQVSINRKKKDNHTLEEMKSKRKNYLNLIEEFDEVEKLSPSRNLNYNILSAKNYIFRINHKKKSRIQKTGKIKRLIWTKNLNRTLAGNNLIKSQKEAFFD